jgi:hypothetical protein
VRAIILATGHDDPGDARGLVGHGHGNQLVGLADQQVGDPGVSVRLGLGQYAEVFVENEIDLEVLPDLSDEFD